MTQLRRRHERRSPLRAIGFGLPLLFALCASSFSACSDDDDSDHDHDVSHAGHGGSGGSASDCVESPSTSTEILNACTDAEKIDKNSHPPLLLPDGGVPPLEGQ